VRISGLSKSITAQSIRDQRLLDQAVRAKEDERLQVAADLHDGPIQRLSAMRLTIELARRRLRRGHSGDVAGLLEQLNGELGEEVMSLRRVMVELRAPVLDEWGIREALYAFAADFQQRTGIACAVSANAARELDRSRETIIYRVTQEALTNVARHARAHHVWIDLDDEDHAVDLTIRDDGAGFDAATLSEVIEQGHFGLAGIRQRVELGGGSCDISSAPGAGTTISVRLPAAGTGLDGRTARLAEAAGGEAVRRP
jgi:two-component system sensor histidine kinase UhpB